MKIVKFDEGFSLDDPNTYWGNPSYQLEPGDPGYVPPSPPSPEPTTKHQIMKTPPHFPVAILIHNGELITTAAQAHAPIATRLTAAYLTETATLFGKVSGDVTGQKTKKGELGNLTKAQQAALVVLQHCMGQARKTAKLAFHGQDVKLHQEFEVRHQTKFDLGSFLGRADIILASVKNADNLAALKLKGWTDADTTAFDTARKAFGPAEQARKQSIGGAKDATTTKDTDAADFYEHLLTIQNAADLEWPATDPANAGVRDEFCLNTFPPSGGNHTPTPAPTPAPQSK